MDGLDSMRQALSNGSSTLASSFDYSAFGEVVGGSGGSSSPYGWGAQSGYRQDSGSGQGDCGLVLMGARWYDPATGRFTSRDSDMGSELLTIPALAGFEDVLPALGHNAYCYCEGDPINYTDPSGHQKAKKDKPWYERLKDAWDNFWGGGDKGGSPGSGGGSGPVGQGASGPGGGSGTAGGGANIGPGGPGGGNVNITGGGNVVITGGTVTINIYNNPTFKDPIPVFTCHQPSK